MRLHKLPFQFSKTNKKILFGSEQEFQKEYSDLFERMKMLQKGLLTHEHGMFSICIRKLSTGFIIVFYKLLLIFKI